METDGVSPTEYLTRSFGESPNVAVESALSRILEEDVPEKYYLSAKACRGILNRAARRRLELPEVLKAALIRQAAYPAVIPPPSAYRET